MRLQEALLRLGRPQHRIPCPVVDLREADKALDSAEVALKLILFLFFDRAFGPATTPFLTMASVACSAMMAPVASRNVTSFKPTKAGKAVFVSNATIKRTTANIKVWQPVDNKVRI